MEIGRLAGQRIREAQEGWSSERISAGHRAAVYAVATAQAMGREELVELRLAAETENETDEVVRLARWFDAATYPLESAPLSVAEALERLEDLGFDPAVIVAFRSVQPLIQPVGLP